eukprot:4114460-Prymnesium_polylepis.3
MQPGADQNGDMRALQAAHVLRRALVQHHQTRGLDGAFLQSGWRPGGRPRTVQVQELAARHVSGDDAQAVRSTKNEEGERSRRHVERGELLRGHRELFTQTHLVEQLDRSAPHSPARAWRRSGTS